MKNRNNIKETPADNERFHASGGAVSSDTEQVTSSFALVRALPIPPPAWSRHHVRCKWRARQRWIVTESQWWQRLPKSGNKKISSSKSFCRSANTFS